MALALPTRDSARRAAALRTSLSVGSVTHKARPCCSQLLVALRPLPLPRASVSAGSPQPFPGESPAVPDLWQEAMCPAPSREVPPAALSSGGYYDCASGCLQADGQSCSACSCPQSRPIIHIHACPTRVNRQGAAFVGIALGCPYPAPGHRHLLPGLRWLLWSGSPILQGGLIRGAALRPPKGSARHHMCPGIWLSGAGPGLLARVGSGPAPTASLSFRTLCPCDFLPCTHSACLGQTTSLWCFHFPSPE